MHKSEVRTDHFQPFFTQIPSLQFSPPQVIIYLRDIFNIKRIDLKPYCLLLETKDKRFSLSFEGDEELYGWQNDITGPYNARTPGISKGANGFTISSTQRRSKSDSAQRSHSTGAYPISRQKTKSNITEGSYDSNPHARPNLLDFLADPQKMAYMGGARRSDRGADNSKAASALDKPEEQLKKQKASTTNEMPIMQKLQQIASRDDPNGLYSKIENMVVERHVNLCRVDGC